MPVHHVNGQPAASTCVREKGGITSVTIRETPCIMYINVFIYMYIYIYTYKYILANIPGIAREHSELFPVETRIIAASISQCLG